MGQACCRRHIVKIDTNDIYNQRTYSFSFKDSQVVDKNQEYSTMEEDYTYDNMPQDEGTSAKVEPKPVARAQQQMEERLAKLEAQSAKQSDGRLSKLEAQMRENANVKRSPAWQLPATILTIILLICLVIFVGISVFGKSDNNQKSSGASGFSATARPEPETTPTTTPTTTTPTTATPTTTTPTETTATPNLGVTGIALVGGYRGVRLNNTELFPSSSCLLPPLIEARDFATLSVFNKKLTLCGGRNQQGTHLNSCIQATSTGWEFFARTSITRYASLSWAPASRPDTLLILGGNADRKSGEELPGGAKFTLAHDVFHSCGVIDKLTMIVSGGMSSKAVTRYNATGGVEEEFVSLPEIRYSHACGLLTSDHMKVPFVVGGWHRASGYTNSVLALLPRATSWKALTSLPKSLAYVGSSMVNGKLWVTGGYGGTYNSDVFEFDFPTNKWTVIGQIKQERYHFAMTGINDGDISCATGEARIQARIVTGHASEDDINLELDK